MQYKIILLSLSALIISGCSSIKTQTVIIHGQDKSESIKLEGPFSDACRAVLGKFGSIYKQTSKEFHINGIESYKASYKTKDKQNYEYTIVIKGNSKNTLIVTLKTTNPDNEKFVNAFYEEFNERGIEFERAFKE